MKTKTIFYLIITAVITLSFTFAIKPDKNETKPSAVNTNTPVNEPLGGFTSEDKL